MAFRLAYTILRASWFLHRPRFNGVKCVLTDQDRVLLVRHSYGPRQWELPGGGIKRHELPSGAARREMREELGIDIDDWMALGEMPASIHGRDGTLHCFAATPSATRIAADRGELAAAAWFAPTALPSDLGPYVASIIARALATAGGDEG